ncbi:cytochrome P450 family protein sad [Rhynchophorus ferrugineus]|uniref:cytochrome P450 family protein sad n=1 Tax=Rhynchophorus ferrugineus TaxID=354439 RepID=UPI003FCEC5B2
MFCMKCVVRCVRADILPRGGALSRIARQSSTTVTKTIDDVPGPKGLPLIGTTLSLLMAGSTPKLHHYIDKRHKEYGSIFKESIGPVPCIFISDAKTIRDVFAHEGKYPIHVLPEAWTTYNTLHNVSRGIFFMDGEEWWHFRRILNAALMKGDQEWLEDSCVPAVENIMRRIRTVSSCTSSYPDMEQILYSWSLEVIISVLVGPQNYLLAKDQIADRVDELALTLRLIFETSSKLMLISSKFAAKFGIPRWQRFEAAVSTALHNVANLVELLLNNYVRENEGLLGKLRGKMTTNELSRIVTDLILAAGDTTAYSMEWTLYLIGKNLDVQKKLREQIAEDEKKSQCWTSNLYLKNTIKESLRLYPVAPFLTRILPKPATIQGYYMPAGSVLIMSIFSTGRDAINFPNPLKFDPDRWMRDDNNGVAARSASIPFAIGSRSCIGKKLAEKQLQITLGELVRNFHVTVDNSEDVDVILEMVAIPSEKIKFQFSSLE